MPGNEQGGPKKRPTRAPIEEGGRMSAHIRGVPSTRPEKDEHEND